MCIHTLPREAPSPQRRREFFRLKYAFERLDVERRGALTAPHFNRCQAALGSTYSALEGGGEARESPPPPKHTPDPHCARTSPYLISPPVPPQRLTTP